MPTEKRIICLANSRKLSGRCIAGKMLENKRDRGWLRPVSAREHEEVSERERQYEDGSDPAVLDIMDVPLLDPRPKLYQQENWLLDPDYYWGKVGRARWSDAAALADPAEKLWVNGHKTFHGQNDTIPLSVATGLCTSLHLVHAERMTVSVFKPGEAFGDPKRRVQGHFHHAASDYKLWVTDPRYERKYLAAGDGDYTIGECLLTISLGEPYKDSVYKLIAAIIEPAGAP
jgi:hypothetical protein